MYEGMKMLEGLRSWRFVAVLVFLVALFVQFAPAMGDTATNDTVYHYNATQLDFVLRYLTYPMFMNNGSIANATLPGFNATMLVH